MLKQIWVAEENRNLQLVLWRENPGSPLQVVTLNKVTYGTTSAPYLAMRCLKEIAIETNREFAIKQKRWSSGKETKDSKSKEDEYISSTVKALERNFYVNHVLTETSNLKKAMRH